MKINTSYDVRGMRISRSTSIPQPTIEDLTNALKYVAWVAEQKAPEITISESQIHDIRG